MTTDLASTILALPFAIVDEHEARVLAILARRAEAGNGAAADALIARLSEDAAVHDLAGNCIKAGVVRNAIDLVCEYSF